MGQGPSFWSRKEINRGCNDCNASATKYKQTENNMNSKIVSYNSFLDKKMDKIAAIMHRLSTKYEETFVQ